jgi:hypothetical protein
MAIAFVRNSGQVATSAPLGGGAISVPITAGAVGNNWIIVVVANLGSGATSLSDSAGTTYQLDQAINDGASVTTQIWSAAIVSAAVTSISVNGLGTLAVTEAAVYEFSGERRSACDLVCNPRLRCCP